MPRIVSLIASATEIVHELGLTDQQVGRSHECDYPDQVRRLPVCTRPSFPTEGTSAEIDRRVKNQVVNALSVYEVFEDLLGSVAAYPHRHSNSMPGLRRELGRC